MSPQKIIVDRLMFFMTGMYQPQVYRPYETSVGMQELAILQESTINGAVITPKSVAGIAGQIFRPTTQSQGQAYIDNGWQSRRMMFLMKVDVLAMNMVSVSYYISGWTDHGEIASGIGDSITLDPNMRMYINNISTVRQSNQITGVGNIVVPELLNSYQLLRGRSTASVNQNFTMHGNVSLRPEDIIGRIDEKHIMSNNNNTPVFSTSQSFGGGGIKASTVRNLVPASHLATTISAVKTQLDNDNGSLSYSDHLMNARVDDNVKEINLSSNPFIHQMNQRAEGFFSQGVFTYRELCTLDHTLDSRAMVISDQTAAAQRGVSAMGSMNVACWDSAMSETIAATVLANSIPAIMVEFLLTSVGISLKTTTRAVASNPPPGATVWTTPTACYLVYFTNIASFGGSSYDVTPFLNAFLTKLMNEVINDITVGGQKDIELIASFSLGISETKIQVAFGGGQLIPFIQPAFCNSLSAPLVSNDGFKTIDTIATDMDNLINQIGNTFGGNPYAAKPGFMV